LAVRFAANDHGAQSIRLEVPVERFRDARDMPPPGRVVGEGLLDTIAGVVEWAHLRRPVSITRGVRRFRSVEEATAARCAEDLAHMRALARDR
jgi:hypothetical protein